MKIFDVNAADLIDTAAVELKVKGLAQPAFVAWAKSGAHKERAPTLKDWYYQRMASILYRIYRDGNTGTGRLATYYGGRKARGTAPHEFRPASRKVIRSALQELEKAKLLVKATKGRVVSPEGEKFLTLVANKTAEFVKKRDADRIIARVERDRVKAIDRKVREETRKAEQKFDKNKKMEKKDKPKKENA